MTRSSTSAKNAAMVPISLAALLTGTATAQAAGPTTTPDPAPSGVIAGVVATPSVARAAEIKKVDLRQGFGLATDGATMARLAARADKLSYFETSFTPEEATQVRRQLDAQQTLAAVGPQIIRTFGAAFTGYWIDHRKGGEITIGATDEKDIAAVRALFPAGTVIRFQKTKHSYAQLSALQAALDSTLVGTGRAVGGVRVVGTNVDVQNQRIELLIPVGAPDISADVTRLFPDQPVALREVNPASYVFKGVGRTDYPPLMGGYQLNVANNFCTAGFGVKVKNTDIRGIVTAGHCGASGKAVSIFTGPSIGNVGNREFSNNGGTDTDSEFIGFNQNAQGRIYVNDVAAGAKHWRSVAGGWANGAPPGSYIHLSAGHRDNTFGNFLVDFDFTAEANFNGTDNRIEHAQSAHLCAEEGDSGSPVYTIAGNEKAGLFAGGKAMAAGVLSGTSQPDRACPDDELVFWSRIDRVTASLGVDLLTE